MTVRAVPSFIQGSAHPAEETRVMLGSLLHTMTGSFAGGVGSVDPGHGVLLRDDLVVSALGTPNMSVNVAVGNCWIRGTQSAMQGCYHMFNDAILNVVISTSDATNPRTDLIVAQIRDATYSGADRDARIVVVTGTPAAVPTVPTVPANSLVLAQIAVAAASTTVVGGNITDKRTLANAHNQIPVIGSTYLRDILFPTPREGQAIYLNTGVSTEGFQTFNGSAWRNGSWNAPWGSQYRQTLGGSAIATVGTTETALHTSGSYTQVGNRLTRTIFSSTMYGTAGDTFTVRLRLDTTAGAPLWVGNMAFGTGVTQFPITIIANNAIPAGARTILFTATRTAGAATTTIGALSTVSVTVEDIGPNGAPS